MALVNTGVGMRAELPSLDQFDHMIVHVPALKVRFVDPTQRNLPGGALPPELFHRSALVLDPRKPRVEAMPDRKEFPPNRINLDRQVRIEASGDAEVQETCRAGGYYGVWLRNSLLGVEPAKRLAYLQTLFPESKWQLLELDVDALDDPSAELVLKTRYRFEGGTPGAVVVPALWEASYLSPPFLKERQNPAQFEHPVVVESRAHVALPKALAAGALDSWSGHADSDLCRWKLAATQADGAMTMDFRFEGVARSLPAARYAEWNTAWTAAVRALQQPIKLVP